ncbi:unnamed protein product [Pleuronectes platessa]|uniref:Uncharacterized protein n=1 Tax=Pleuronectes platessa TaxID=8262 RepID=A0A9N7VAU5_PLEPL|nr:unnamed protein product [Pleuronectes platessa]
MQMDHVGAPIYWGCQLQRDTAASFVTLGGGNRERGTNCTGLHKKHGGGRHETPEVAQTSIRTNDLPLSCVALRILCGVRAPISPAALSGRPWSCLFVSFHTAERPNSRVLRLSHGSGPSQPLGSFDLTDRRRGSERGLWEALSSGNYAQNSHDQRGTEIHLSACPPVGGLSDHHTAISRPLTPTQDSPLLKAE